MNIFDILNVPLGYLIRLCYTIIPNYALALLLFAILIKAILFPLGIKQQKNSVKQASLRPRETAIRNRYAGRTDKATQQKMNEEVMELYKSENFNPAAGCLPLLVEMPILFALYNIVTNPLKYISDWPAETISAVSERISELGGSVGNNIQMINFMKGDFGSVADLVPIGFTIGDLPDFTIFGGFFDLSQTPSFSEPSWLLLIPVLTFSAMFLSMKINRRLTYQPQAQADQQSAMSMKIMDFTMPLFSVWISFTVPAVLGLYWVYQNGLSVLRQFILYKLFPIPKFTDEDYKQAEREMNGKLTKAQKKAIKQKTRSLHNIDGEDAPDSGDGDGESKEPAAIQRAQLKDDNMVPKDSADKGGTAKKKVRSLHRIDEEDEVPEPDEEALKQSKPEDNDNKNKKA